MGCGYAPPSDAPAYYGVVRQALPADRLPEDMQAEVAAQIEVLIEQHKIRDWQDNPEILNRMRNAVEDYLYGVEKAQNIHFSNASWTRSSSR